MGFSRQEYWSENPPVTLSKQSLLTSPEWLCVCPAMTLPSSSSWSLFYLLRYNWHMALHYFQVYNIRINICICCEMITVSQDPLPPCFFVVMRTYVLILLILFIWLYWVLVATSGSSLQCIESLVMAHELGCFAAFRILVPWPGIKPVSSALQSEFQTTGPPGKSQSLVFLTIAIPSVSWYPGDFDVYFPDD